MNDELEQFLFRVPLADRFPAGVAEAGVLEQRGVDFFDGEQRVVELGVAHDVEAPSFGRHDFSQALEMQLDANGLMILAGDIKTSLGEIAVTPNGINRVYWLASAGGSSRRVTLAAAKTT